MSEHAPVPVKYLEPEDPRRGILQCDFEGIAFSDWLVNLPEGFGHVDSAAVRFDPAQRARRVLMIYRPHGLTVKSIRIGCDEFHPTDMLPAVGAGVAVWITFERASWFRDMHKKVGLHCAEPVQ